MRFDRFMRAADERNAAIVMQVSWANGLDIIRDLSTAGVPLLALDSNARALGLHSRLAAGVVCPDPREDETAFLSYLEDLGRRFSRRPVLFPTHDQYIWPISKHAERLEKWFIIPFSRWETMRRLHDKREQLESAWLESRVRWRPPERAPQPSGGRLLRLPVTYSSSTVAVKSASSPSVTRRRRDRSRAMLRTMSV